VTAPVISLDSHRRNRPPTCGCPRHTLEALVSRSLDELAGTEGALLVDRELMARMVDDVVSTVEAALASQHGRTNP
jgi:hypothetical protein